MKFFHKTICLTFFALFLAGFSASAAETKTTASTSVPVAAAPSAASKELATPDPATNPALQLVMRSGAKLYYLGNQAGLNGWILVKEGQIQFVYAAPDGQHVLVGALFGPHGEDVTAKEADAVLNANPELKNAVGNTIHKTLETGKSNLMDEMQNGKTADFMAPTVPAVTISPGERLYQDMYAAKSVLVGKNPSAPLLFMVIDPNCPHCQATWRMLRDYVFKGALQVRLVPMGDANSDSERAAAQLLSVADPLDAWNKYVDGDTSLLAGTADKKLVTAVQANHIMVDDWDLQSTPILVYRGKDGKVKIEQGEPAKIDTIIDDIAPSLGR